jgi:hypothetical protein
MPFFKSRKSKIKASASWFWGMLSKANKNKFQDDSFEPKNDPFIGGMFFYRYDAKYKDTLPYWDAFPLVIPFRLGHGVDNVPAMWGLNLHYLPPVQRNVLLNNLIPLQAKTKTKERYMKLSYAIIKQHASSKWYEPAVHMYLIPRIKTKLIKVKPEDWRLAINLPVASWQKGRPY